MISSSLLRGVFFVVTFQVLAGCASSDRPSLENDARQLVSASVDTLQLFETSDWTPGFKELFPTSRGLIIFPSLIKGGFFIGGEGGHGVLLARQPDDSWGQPAFYTLAAGSIGFQVGLQQTEVVMLLRTDEAVKSILRNQGKLGGDVGMTFGIYGSGAELSASTILNADVAVFANSIVGLYGGGSLEGAAFIRRRDLNQAFYGVDVLPEHIVFGFQDQNAGADRLRQVLASLSFK